MPRPSLLRPALAGLALLVAAEASAQTPPAPPAPASPPPAPAGTVATATGTIPPPAPPAPPPETAEALRLRSRPAAPVRGRAVVRRKAKGAKVSDAPEASSPSFRILDGGASRFWVEVSRKVAVTEHKAQGRVVYSLAGAQVSSHNSNLAMNMGFFATPVGRVTLVEQGNGADFVLELREAAEPTYHVVDTPRGIAIQVDFPRPASVPDAAQPDAAPPERARRSSETKRLEMPSND